MRISVVKPILIWTVVGLLWTLAACASAPPQPVPEWASFDSFVETLEATAGSGKQRDVDALWQTLVDRKQVPLIMGERVAFLYRGRAGSVQWVGDFTDWSRGSALKGQRVGKSDIWVAYETFPTDARLDYRIVVDGKDGVPDPVNPLQQWGGFGPNSVVAMPDYVFPQEVLPRDDVRPGTLSAPIAMDSANLGYRVNYQVYTPAGYEALAGLPALYVTDAHEYTDTRMGSLPIVLDNLVADGKIEPLLAVFIDPRDPETGRNRRESEFLDNPAYTAFLARELVPSIDNAYKTDPAPEKRAILGISYGGVNAASCGWAYPDVFGLVGMQSPAFAGDRTVYEHYRSADWLPLRFFLSTGYPWDVDARTMKGILEDKGCELMYMEVPEGHSWGQWRSQFDDLLVYFFPRVPS